MDNKYTNNIAVIAPLLICFLLIGLIGFSQKSQPQKANSQRLQTIEKQIDVAVNNENYKKAENLKKEENIRKKMAIAFENKDYARLADLKKELDNCNCIEKNVSPKKVAEQAQQTAKEKENNKYRNNTFVKYFNFVPLAYIKTKYTESHDTWQNGSEHITNNEINNDLEGGGFRIGGTIFFRAMKPKQKLKVGFDIQFVSFSAGLDFRSASDGVIYFSVARPGIVLKQYLNNQSGFIFRANAGSAFAVSSMNAVGMGINAEAKYWIKNFSIGIEYQYLAGIDGDTPNASLHQLGITCGFQFSKH